MRGKSFIFLCICLLSFSLASCRKTVGPTIIEVQDTLRHYLPVVQGDELRINYLVYNRGKNLLIFTDIQPACLSIELAQEAPKFILPGDSAHLAFIFHTLQNVGFTEQKIRLYGNFKEGEQVLTFDVHIVRPSVDQSDYEELYLANLPEAEVLVDGTLGEKGYFTDETVFEAF